jgi:hypothetical protein
MRCSEDRTLDNARLALMQPAWQKKKMNHGDTEARLYYRAAMRILFSAQKKE